MRKTFLALVLLTALGGCSGCFNSQTPCVEEQKINFDLSLQNDILRYQLHACTTAVKGKLLYDTTAHAWQFTPGGK